MGKWRWRKPEPSTERGLCVKCGRNPQKSRGSGKYKPLCSLCDKREFSWESHKRQRIKSADRRKRPYRQFVGTQCERCGFVPEDICQLDVDHIDNDHSNNSPDNLQTLCANCHRLKTKKAAQG